MKVAAIGLTALEIDFACLATLSKFVREGHEVYIIVASDAKSIDWTEDEARNFFEEFGLANMHCVDRRDYSTVTQENASALDAYIKKFKPDMAIMPYWKSQNQQRKILARTALIACRGIGSILMYELDKNPGFTPTISFVVSAKELAAKVSAIESGSILGLTVRAAVDNSDTAAESFECHRMSLVEDSWL